ncbi:Hypothetical predicted protein [Mytilus galloprovincialis]|nr:Hypothetical predicted protein [Mytilus galloprovincialis]
MQLIRLVSVIIGFAVTACNGQLDPSDSSVELPSGFSFIGGTEKRRFREDLSKTSYSRTFRIVDPRQRRVDANSTSLRNDDNDSDNDNGDNKWTNGRTFVHTRRRPNRYVSAIGSISRYQQRPISSISRYPQQRPISNIPRYRQRPSSIIPRYQQRPISGISRYHQRPISTFRTFRPSLITRRRYIVPVQ